MADIMHIFYRTNAVRSAVSLITLAYFGFIVISAATPKPPKATKKTPSQIKELLLKFSIIPDVLEKPPKRIVQVIWPKAAADFGNFIPAQYTKDPPDVTWYISKGFYYTLLMVDPDRDKHTEFDAHEYKYWLIGNIPGRNLSAGQTFANYIPPRVPKALHFERYIFMVFKHPKKEPIKFDEPRLISDSDLFRAHFRTKDFMEKYGLGLPYAINFFHGEWAAWNPPQNESDIMVDKEEGTILQRPTNETQKTTTPVPEKLYDDSYEDPYAKFEKEYLSKDATTQSLDDKLAERIHKHIKLEDDAKLAQKRAEKAAKKEAKKEAEVAKKEDQAMKKVRKGPKKGKDAYNRDPDEDYDNDSKEVFKTKKKKPRF